MINRRLFIKQTDAVRNISSSFHRFSPLTARAADANPAFAARRKARAPLELCIALIFMFAAQQQRNSVELAICPSSPPVYDTLSRRRGAICNWNQHQPRSFGVFLSSQTERDSSALSFDLWIQRFNERDLALGGKHTGGFCKLRGRRRFLCISCATKTASKQKSLPNFSPLFLFSARQLLRYVAEFASDFYVEIALVNHRHSTSGIKHEEITSQTPKRIIQRSAAHSESRFAVGASNLYTRRVNECEQERGFALAPAPFIARV